MAVKKASPLAYAESLLVTFLWSTSFVLIKVGLSELPPFLFAAVRYSLAFAVLAMIGFIVEGNFASSRRVATKSDGGLSLLMIAGVCGYTLAQGFQFVGLFYLSAVTTTFLLNFTPIFVLFLGILFLREQASRLQLAGLAIALFGAYMFLAEKFSWGDQFGVLIVLISGFAWAVYLVIIRKIQRARVLSSLRLTTVTMGIGTAGLVVLAALFDGLRPLSLNALAIVLWLSVANTALAFLLWNHALKSIRPYELSVIQNTMLVQIAVLAWIFLGESLTYFMIFGVVLVLAGVLLVQVPAINRVDK